MLQAIPLKVEMLPNFFAGIYGRIRVFFIEDMRCTADISCNKVRGLSGLTPKNLFYGDISSHLRFFPAKVRSFINPGHDTITGKKIQKWTRRDLNPRHLRCERSYLPLIYEPGKKYRGKEIPVRE